MYNSNSPLDNFKSELSNFILGIITAEMKKVPYPSCENEKDQLMTLEEAADYLKISTRTLIKRIKEGKIITGGTGRKYLFNKKDLDAFAFKTKK